MHEFSYSGFDCDTAQGIRMALVVFDSFLAFRASVHCFRHLIGVEFRFQCVASAQFRCRSRGLAAPTALTEFELTGCAHPEAPASRTLRCHHRCRFGGGRMGLPGPSQSSCGEDLLCSPQ